MSEAPLLVWFDLLEELGIVVLTAKGPVDGYTYDLLQKRINQSIVAGHYRIVVDLSGVNYISSAGLGVFISARNKVIEKGGSIVLLNLSKPVREVFRALSMDEYMNVATSMQEAITAFQPKKKTG